MLYNAEGHFNQVKNLKNTKKGPLALKKGTIYESKGKQTPDYIISMYQKMNVLCN